MKLTLFLKRTNDDISTMVVQNSKGKNIGSDNVQSWGKVLMGIFCNTNNNGDHDDADGDDVCDDGDDVDDNDGCWVSSADQNCW